MDFEKLKLGLELVVLAVSLGAIVFQAGASHAKNKATFAVVEEVKAMMKAAQDKCGTCRDQLDQADEALGDRMAKIELQQARVEENLRHGWRL